MSLIVATWPNNSVSVLRSPADWDAFWLFDDGRFNHFDSSDIRIMGNAMYGIPDPQQPE